jgi:putative membrane protein
MNRKTSLLMSLGISLALIAAGIWFLYSHHYRFMFGDGRWTMPHQAMFGGGGMGIIMIVFWVVVIAAIALAVSGMISNRQAPGRREGEFGSDALEILRRRYARGEIDKQQYEAMRRDLIYDLRPRDDVNL